MSLILDALRKSERTRQQSLTGQLGANETPGGPSRMPVPWIPLIGAILILNAVLLFFFWPDRAPVPAASASVPTPAPVYHPAVRPLADEAGADAAPASAPAQDNASSLPTPAQAGPARANSITPAAQAAAISTLPTLDSLTPEQRGTLPALHMDVHGYANNPRDRFVVINLKQYRIGDSLADGLTLKDIVPQGAVLEYHGTTFLLPAT